MKKSFSVLKSTLVTLACLMSICATTASFAQDTNESRFAVPFSKYTLDNGLTLIVHQDSKAPIVAVNVWYHVGSKDEQKGRTGLAHLFEHLMFNGSENYNDDWFKAFDRVGATGLNGTTSQDRTNYFQVVPKNALEMTLWMESDRMGHLLGAIDQAKLDEQRDVVKNEKRQGENQPYGTVFNTILQNVFPSDHPYSWTPIGSMEDLDAASLEDVKDWFREKYGAANATLVIAGDVEPDATLELVKKYFGHIAAGPPLKKQSRWVAKRTGKHSQVMQDRVPQARLYKIWNIPEWGSPEADYLDIASRVLSSDKRSRLYNRLVYNERKASDVSAFSFNSEIAGLFGIVATAINPADLDYIEKAIDEELAKFFAKGPTQSELKRVKSGLEADFVRGLEGVGGFGGKSDILARSQVFAGHPNAFIESVERSLNASAETVTQTAQQWLSDGSYSLHVLPFGEYSTTPSAVDRSTGIPPLGEAPTVAFDRLERATLENGLNIILAERTAIPTVNMSLMFDGGFSADYQQKAGVANLTMAMLDEGTKRKNALEISTELAELGTNISSRAGLNTSRVNLDTLKSKLEPSMELYADIVLNPSFPQAELDRLKEQQLVAIAREKSSPFGMAYRALPKLIYGSDHPYSNPFSGTGNEQSVSSIEVADLERYHQTSFSARNATLVVTGDITMGELVPLAKKYLGKMKPGSRQSMAIAPVEAPEQPKVFLIDRPDAPQSAIIATQMVPAYGYEGELPLQLMNEVFGGSFNARLNMNLREDKGWAYGASSSIPGIKGQRPLLISTSVQEDKTAESVLELQKEVQEISDSRTISQDELARALDKETLTLPGRWETAGAVAGDIASMVTFGLDESYWDSYVSRLRNLTLDQVQAAASENLKANELIWVIVGDRAKIEAGIRQANIGEVTIVSSEGEVLE